jgi:predicted hotdog family 3-hydroxylacyl-ACP dehydratase
MNHATKPPPQPPLVPSLPLPATRLLPHRGRMLLVEELTAYDETSGRGRIRAKKLTESHFARPNGFLEEVVMIEMLAQAYACIRGFEDLKTGREIGPGFLVGIRHWQLRKQATSDAELQVEIATTTVIGDFFLAAGKVLDQAGKPLAEGELKLWTP